MSKSLKGLTATALAAITIAGIGTATPTAPPAEAASMPGPGTTAGCRVWRSGSDLWGKCDRSPGDKYFMEVTCSTWWGKKWVDWGYSRYAPNTAGITCGFGNTVIGGRLARNDWRTLARY